MHVKSVSLAAGFFAAVEVGAMPKLDWTSYSRGIKPAQHPISNVELGPRPYYLTNDMDDGPLKQRLSSCSEMEMRPTKFSIGHRGGACLQFPEETVESIMAGTRMGAGIQECDVAFTRDRELVCRHDQCDLHTTTNIVATDLGAKCSTPFTPASNGAAATAKCCTSDITFAEFKTLCGKMDGSNSSAMTPEDYLHGTPAWRTDLYATCGTVLGHKEYISLVDSLGLDFTPELKAPAVPMPFDGDYTVQKYQQQLADEYREAGIAFSRVWPQSFQLDAVAYWIANEPEFGAQAVLLDESGDSAETFPGAVANLTTYKEAGVQIVAPPLPYLVALGEGNNYVPSAYAVEAKRLGLKLLTWSLERSGPLANVAAGEDYYYVSIANGTVKDGDMYRLVDVLVQEVGVIGIFSDWSSTVTYYANCFDLF
ncbi:PLC-like phosphodiesterase [Pseudomassariella vexata]|uniref:glycerophosphodiester phosphodiesterase n=1 Tax=Pseudomassariella vexata TaxID=1141098 RepID=A0A1Y2EGJ5_9PEZI|nr:PLC-like phosphodiesterase [Pseudomassariella vexata]ORY70376.1 PLC-like phosphodiesterase [Pseudomassariella vexata]